MRTKVHFKFFVIIAIGLLAIAVDGLATVSAFDTGISLFMDTIPVRRQGNLSSDTIPFSTDSIPEFRVLGDSINVPPYFGTDSLAIPDTLAQQTQPPRKTGSGTILDQRVDYSARDSIRLDIRTQVVYLYGEAELTYGEIHLTSGYVALNFKEKELLATGLPDSTGTMANNPIFTEGEQSFESKELRYNFETRRGRTVNVITEEGDGFLHGDVVKLMETKVVHVRSGKYTTCDDPNPHFHISFERAKILPNDKIITSAPQLTIMNVRTPLILPFGFFPNSRKQTSGILIPSYGETNNRGFYLQNGGFYWAGTEYFDVSIRGDIYSRGSWGTQLGSNYRVRYKYSGSLNLNYAINIMGERNLPGYERSRDFRIVWNHSQDPKARPNSVFRANVNAGSSTFNRFNPSTSNQYLSNTFSSNVSYSARLGERVNFSVNARHSQNTITKKVDLNLPDVTLSVNRFYPLRRRNPEGKLRWYEEITMNYNATASNQIETVEDALFTASMFDSIRSGVQHSIPISHSFRVLRHFNLSNSVNYNEKWYFQRINKQWVASEIDDNEIVTDDEEIPGEVVSDTLRGFWATRDFSYSSSLNTRIYGLKQFKRGPVLAVRHVINPSFGFSYRPDFADPFWGIYDSYQDPNFDEPTRYSYYETGIYRPPGAGESGSFNLSVTNNLEMKVRSRKDTIKGERKIALIDNLSFSTSYDIARDSLNLSDLRISGRTRLFDKFDITYSSSWSPYATDTLGRAINKFLWETEGKLLRQGNNSWNLNFNYNLSSKKAVSGPSPSQRMQQNQQGGLMPQEELQEQDETLAAVEQPPAGTIDYDVPWSLRFSYSLNYGSSITRPKLIRESKVVQSLTFSGDFNLTPNWRIGFSSGYNFEDKEITYTSLDIYRDLHCWELLINWIPFGFRQSYNMTLRVKSSILQDLKVERRTHHLDRAFAN